MAHDAQLADSVASASLELYKKLPFTAKPNKPGEWTLLATIVLESGEGLKVVSLGTGSKCIGKCKMSPLGDILNDSHAEIMARRGFIRYLYDQVKLIHNNNKSDVFSKLDANFKCVLKQDIKFHFFISHTPCGDASIIPKSDTNLRKRKSSEDGSIKKILKVDTDSSVNSGTGLLQDLSIPGVDCHLNSTLNPETNLVENVGADQEMLDVFRTGAKCVPGSTQDPKLPGVYYHRVSAVRTKPGRGDPTLSLSCSDKICRWSVVGIQGALLSILIDCPVYLSSVVIASSCPYSEQAMRRALIARISQEINFPPPFCFQAPKLLQSSLAFPDGEKSDSGRPCPTSMVWCALSKSDKLIEVSVEGKRQGITKKLANTPVAQLQICKLAFLREFVSIVDKLGVSGKLLIENCDNNFTKLPYSELKAEAKGYQTTWNMLKESCFPEWPSKPKLFVQFKAFKD